jgi:hypothetical protein
VACLGDVAGEGGVPERHHGRRAPNDWPYVFAEGGLLTWMEILLAQQYSSHDNLPFSESILIVTDSNPSLNKYFHWRHTRAPSAMGWHCGSLAYRLAFGHVRRQRLFFPSPIAALTHRPSVLCEEGQADNVVVCPDPARHRPATLTRDQLRTKSGGRPSIRDCRNCDPIWSALTRCQFGVMAHNIHVTCACKQGRNECVGMPWCFRGWSRRFFSLK